MVWRLNLCLKTLPLICNGDLINSRGRRSHAFLSPFLLNFGVIWPHFLLKPAALEWAFDPLQAYTHIVGWIFTAGKWVIVHTMPSMTFFGEPKPFHEVRPPKTWYTLHKLSFDIFWQYFENVRKSCFTRLNCQFKLCLDLPARLTRCQKWKPRSPLDSLQCHESSGGLKILKWASVCKHIFRGKSIAQFCMKV